MNPAEEGWSGRQRAIFWSVVAVALVLPRVLLQQALPMYLFSDDSHSYLLSAFHWTQTGDWETSPRRGALYSLLIAGVLRFFANLNVLTVVQHFLGGAAVLTAIATFRKAAPRRLFWPALLVSVAFSLAAYPIYFEQLVRSEVLLFLFSALALGMWATYLRRPARRWLLLAGIFFGVATLVKNLLLPFPVVLGVFLFCDSKTDWKQKTQRLGCLLVGISLPFLAEKSFNAASGHFPPPAPQSGILLYGRVAQWTVLDGESQPEIKALIRSDIEAYRLLPRLNNNIILKRTAVPKIYLWVKARRGTEAQVNQICRTLAVEAIQAQFPAWLRQVWGDFQKLHTGMDFPTRSPTADDLADARLSTTKMKHQHPMLRQQEVLDTLARPGTVEKLRAYHAVTAGSWLFRWHPVLLTSLVLPFLIWLDRSSARRTFWITLGAIWIFNVAIICTVGRPIPRYLMASLPILFWVLGGTFLHAWVLLVTWWKSRQPQLPPTQPA